MEIAGILVDKKTIEFIKKAKKIQKEKNREYDYSKFVYVNGITKGTVICKEHGEFLQIPVEHLRKKTGCPKCYYEKNTKTKEQFLEDIKKTKKHLNDDNTFKYDYSKFIYIKNDVPSIIICKKHGEFLQTPHTHIKGHGCKKCGFEHNSIDDLIKKANIIHNNKYDYSKFEFTIMIKKSVIICKKHGKFKKSMSSHLKGSGCPNCRKSNGEQKIRLFLEENNIKYEPQKTFDECVGIRNKLPFDFYISDLNVLIEYDGRQHFEQIKHWGGEKKFLKNKECDKIKNDFASKNGIKLIRIPYHIKDINKELKKLLGG